TDSEAGTSHAESALVCYVTAGTEVSCLALLQCCSRLDSWRCPRLRPPHRIRSGPRPAPSGRPPGPSALPRPTRAGRRNARARRRGARSRNGRNLAGQSPSGPSRSGRNPAGRSPGGSSPRSGGPPPEAPVSRSSGAAGPNEMRLLPLTAWPLKQTGGPPRTMSRPARWRPVSHFTRIPGSMMNKSLGFTAFLALMAVPLAAQMQSGADAIDRAAATITEADVSRRIHVIAHDSMLGRNTPSRGLDLTAQYIADEFKRFGLKPGGENGTWFQRYPIVTVKLDVAASHVGFMFGDKHLHAEFARDARRVAGPIPTSEVGGPAVVIANMTDPKS